MAVERFYRYALTGSLEELEELKAKLEEADKRALLPNGRKGETDFGDLIELLGGDRKEAGEYRCRIACWGSPDWNEVDPNDEGFDYENWIKQYHRIDRNKYGEYYIMIDFIAYRPESPRMRNIFTNAYKSLRIFVEWERAITNDEEYRFFDRNPRLPYLCDDGLHYRLLDNGEAHLYADSLIKDDTFCIPTTTTHNGKTYKVVGVYNCDSEEGDWFGYGSATVIKVLYVPEQIQFIDENSFCYSNLEKVVFEGDIRLHCWSFGGCEHLSEVVFKGKNNIIDSSAFEGSRCADSILYNEV